MRDLNSFGWNTYNAAWTWHQDILTAWPSVVTWLWLITRNGLDHLVAEGYTHVHGDSVFQVDRELEYLHRSPASRKRWRKGNPKMLGGITEHPLFEGLGPLSDCTANCKPVLSSERSPHRSKTATLRQQHSDRKKYLVQVSQGCSTASHTDWLSVVK
jgi:hypothetical protein